jgi:hypothetical protein
MDCQFRDDDEMLLRKLGGKFYYGKNQWAIPITWKCVLNQGVKTLCQENFNGKPSNPKELLEFPECKDSNCLQTTIILFGPVGILTHPPLTGWMVCLWSGTARLWALHAALQGQHAGHPPDHRPAPAGRRGLRQGGGLRGNAAGHAALLGANRGPRGRPAGIPDPCPGFRPIGTTLTLPHHLIQQLTNGDFLKVVWISNGSSCCPTWKNYFGG